NVTVGRSSILEEPWGVETCCARTSLGAERIRAMARAAAPPILAVAVFMIAALLTYESRQYITALHQGRLILQWSGPVPAWLALNKGVAMLQAVFSSRNEPPPISRGGWLDALRFIVAALIILHHFQMSAPVPLAESLHPVFERGGFLLTNFFLIDSGYVLMRVYGRAVG